MRNLIVLYLFISTVLCSGQDSSISINYGIFRTTYYQNDIQIGKGTFKDILQADSDAYKIFKDGRFLMTSGNVIMVPSIILLVVTIENYNQGNTPYTWQWIGGISGSLVGTILYYTGKNRTIESVKVFNSNKNLSFNLSGKNGIGVSMNF